MYKLVAAMIAISISAASVEAAPLWTETDPVDGLALYVGHARWVRFHGAWYRAKDGLARSPDGVTWKPVSGVPSAFDIEVTPGALFVNGGGQFWRSDDGEHWTAIKLGVGRTAGFKGDAKLLVAMDSTSRGFRCSTDSGVTWTAPGRGWVTAESVYGVGVANGEAWISFLVGTNVVTIRSADGCRTWKTMARGRHIRAMASGVIVVEGADGPEVSFDGGKTWRPSPLHDSTTGVLTSVATPKGYLHTMTTTAWFVTETGNRRVELPDTKGIHEPIGYANDDYVYLYGDAGGAPRVYRVLITDLMALPSVR